MSWKDKCAVMAVWNHPEAAFLTYLGLYALQHRGQEGAGIASLHKGRHLIHKSQGLVGEAFSTDRLDALLGRAAIGHTRYATTGADDLKNIQPLTRELPFMGPVSVSHNGNIVNHRILKKQSGGLENNQEGKGESDTESLFPLLAQNAASGDLGVALKKSLAALEGAFSLAVLTKDSLAAARDPLGFRPLVLGEKDGAFIAASETCAFDLIGAKYLREIEPGEILIMDGKGMRSERLPQKETAAAKKKAQCIFEYVYFSRPDSLVFAKMFMSGEKADGVYLAQEHPVEADLVIPVPDSGVPAALGYAKESGLPYEMGIIRNHYIGRTFIHPTPSIRNFRVKIKLNPQSHLVRGKRVVAVDDSIVRGTTSRSLIEVLRQAGAKEVHLRVSSPPIKAPCYYGVDTPQKKQLISAYCKDTEEIRKSIGADSLAYLSYQSLLRAGGKGEYCLACFDEKYPTKTYAERL